jgi:hypothetical protein
MEGGIYPAFLLSAVWGGGRSGTVAARHRRLRRPSSGCRHLLPVREGEKGCCVADSDRSATVLRYVSRDLSICERRNASAFLPVTIRGEMSGRTMRGSAGLRIYLMNETKPASAHQPDLAPPLTRLPAPSPRIGTGRGAVIDCFANRAMLAGRDTGVEALPFLPVSIRGEMSGRTMRGSAAHGLSTHAADERRSPCKISRCWRRPSSGCRHLLPVRDGEKGCCVAGSDRSQCSAVAPAIAYLRTPRTQRLSPRPYTGRNVRQDNEGQRQPPGLMRSKWSAALASFQLLAQPLIRLPPPSPRKRGEGMLRPYPTQSIVTCPGSASTLVSHAATAG